MSASLYDRLLNLDAALVKAGFPALSPFWRRTLKRFLSSDKRRLVLRVGRRGGKSLTLAKLAVCIALFGDWTIAPGELAAVAFLSIDRPEAAERLRSIRAMLDALGARYTPRGEEVELHARPVLFRVMTASIGGVVGRTTILVVADEVARWRDSDTGANPAREIIASITPAMLTQPSARMVLSSAPWSTTDYHAECFDRGDDAAQLVAHAPSWIANPSVSEAETRALEPDPRVWSREYAALAADAVSSVATTDEVNACTAQGVTLRPPVPGVEYALLLDVGLRNDRTAVVVVHRELRPRDDGRAGDGGVADVIVCDALEHLVPTFLRPVALEQVLEAVSRLARTYRVTTVRSDLHYIDAIRGPLLDRGISLEAMPMTSPAITARIEMFESKLAGQEIDLLDLEAMRTEILQAQKVMHPGGRLTLRAPDRRGCHDDILSTLLLACDAEIARKLPASTSAAFSFIEEPMGWNRQHGFHGGEKRWFRNGVRCAPPRGTPEFTEYAKRLLRQGAYTTTIAQWVERERGKTIEQALADPESV